MKKRSSPPKKNKGLNLRVSKKYPMLTHNFINQETTYLKEFYKPKFASAKTKQQKMKVQKQFKKALEHNLKYTNDWATQNKPQASTAPKKSKWKFW